MTKSQNFQNFYFKLLNIQHYYNISIIYQWVIRYIHCELLQNVNWVVTKMWSGWVVTRNVNFVQIRERTAFWKLFTNTEKCEIKITWKIHNVNHIFSLKISRTKNGCDPKVKVGSESRGETGVSYDSWVRCKSGLCNGKG